MSVLASVGIFLAEEGHSATEAHHWWLPETKEIIWGGLAFLIVFGFLWWKAGPAIKQMLHNRTARIQKALDDAASAKADADRAAAQITANLGNLDAEKARIVSDAHAAAEQLKVDGMVRNDVEVAELEAKADADIAVGASRVSNELQAQVATLSSDAAERIVQAQLDDATLQDLVEQYIAKVGSGS
jgi:F-type H+-transporting ATPase subunit b